MKKVLAGADLHSNNVVIGIVDEDGKRVAQFRAENRLSEVVKLLAPYKKRLECIAVESTYNWYWLVDGLQALKYPVALANPAAMQQYNGIKHADDTNDAFFLAELLRLKILPTGYIYDAQLRPVRDLLRRRLMLIHQRTALILSFKSLYTRTTGKEMPLGEVKKLESQAARDLYDHPANQLIAGMQIQHIDQLTETIDKIEKVVLGDARDLPIYSRLLTLPGIGKILGMTIPWRWEISAGLPARATLPATAARSRRSAPPTAKRKAITTPNVAINIWPGLLWKRPTSRGATIRSAGGGMTARPPKRVLSSRPKRWPPNWPRRPGT
jgi:transposase